MKLSRPALASAAALIIAASSLSLVHSTPADEPLAVTLLGDGTERPAPEPDPKAAAGSNPVPAAETGNDGQSDQGGAPAADAAINDPLNPSTNEEVPQDLVEKGNEVPADHGQETLVEMERLLEAPEKVSGKGAQWWYSTTYKTRVKKDGDGNAVKDKDGKELREIVKGDDGLPVQTDVEAWTFTSPAMDNRKIPVAILPAKDSEGKRIAGAPTLYMLNGAGGAEQNADWITSGDANIYFKGKPVNVVIPMEGAFSYYVDWLEDGDKLAANSPYFKGAQKWTTFLGKELLPTVEKYLDADGKRAVVGMSMSATSSLLLAEHYPGKFDAVGSFSGCAATSTPIPWAFAGLTVNRAASNGGRVTPAHAWGPMGSPYNRYNDALVNADKLEGTKLYISNASGLSAKEDMYGYRTKERDQSPSQALSGSATTLVEGGVIEGATNACTHDLRAKLNSLNIPAHYEFKNTGTHSWPVWKDDMQRSWNTVIGPALLGDKFVPDADMPSMSSWNPNGSSQNAPVAPEAL